VWLTSTCRGAGERFGKNVVLWRACRRLILLGSLFWGAVCSHLGEVACSGQRFPSEGGDGALLSWSLLR
jgi:hypothetical protein